MPDDYTTPESRAAMGKPNGYADLLTMALAVAATGLPVFPCGANKRPAIPKAEGGNGFLDASTDPAVIRRLFAHSGSKLIGVPTGPRSGFDAVDLDPRNGSDPWRAANIHRLPETRVHRTPGLPKKPSDPIMPGEHWLFQHVDGVVNDQSGKKIAPGVDVRGEGGYVIYPPSDGYSVISDAEIAPCPPWLLDLLLRKPEPEPEPERKPPRRSPESPDQFLVRWNGWRDSLLANVRNAPDSKKHDARLKNSRALGGGLHLTNHTESEAHGWLMSALPDSTRATRADMESASKTITYGLRVGMAKPFKELPDRPYPNGKPRPGPTGAKPEPAKAEGNPADLDGFDLTEDGIALAFTAKHKGELRYCHHAGAWYRWIGTIWKREETKLAFSWARRTCRAFARDAGKLKATIARAATAAAVERYAQSDREFAVTSETWDRDPWLLGTPGGTVDLRTGNIRPARQEDYITKSTSVTPADTADCPTWLAFLAEFTGGNQLLIDFLQRFLGYCLTGDTSEHALAFFHGTGGNGKGTLLNTVFNVMGAYSVNAAMETFVESRNERHSTDLAMLAGARFVLTTEVSQGQVWNEARVKTLTGGDPITARFMRRDNFTYLPQFKLGVSGNHKPKLRNVDEAWKRRMNLIPCLNKPAKVDHALPLKLKKEAAGILRWLIDGCIEWQQFGLNPPPVVQAATAEYFEAENAFGNWLAECCIMDPNLQLPPTDLLRSFQDWCKANGEEIPSGKKFYDLLDTVDGVRHGKSGSKRYWRGIGLNRPARRDYEPD